MLGLLTCAPLQAAGYIAVSHRAWYGLALCCVPIAAGWVGLLNRPVLDVIADRNPRRYELSAKGAILGATLTFALLLVLAPHGVDRTKLIAIFIACSTFFYAFGKLGCVAVGCCRATSTPSPRIPLPVIEVLGSAVVGLLAVASLSVPTTARLAVFVALALAFGALRVLSRRARGMESNHALAQPDSLAMTSVAILFAFLLLVST